MPKDFSRAERVAELVKHEIANLVRRELSASSTGLVTISTVRLTSDLSLASVFYTVIGSDENKANAQEALDDARGLLRHYLAKSLALRKVPQLKFIFDVSVERGSHLSALIDSAVAEDKRKAENSEQDED